MTEKLKPCPFCGNSETVTFTPYTPAPDYNWAYSPTCQKCGTCGPSGKSIEQAIEQWNTRPIPIVHEVNLRVTAIDKANGVITVSAGDENGNN